MEEQTAETQVFGCNNCGADLQYQPGTEHLECAYCGTDNEIPKLEVEIKEFDFYESLKTKTGAAEDYVDTFVKCDACGASSTLEPNLTSALCPYCASPLVLERAHEEHVIKPQSLLPFKLTKEEAHTAFKGWIKGLWFAPGDLKKATLNFDHFKGIYLPYWTFDTDTSSYYRGQRGTHYYVTEKYTTTEDGKTVQKERRVRKTRWTSVSGNVSHFFDDILVVATESLPNKYLYKLEPWDLENLTPFDKKFLSGFLSEKYQVDQQQGFEKAKGIADQKIRSLIRSDIGGDEQRIHTVNTDYSDITFKHLLLPVYVSAYRFKDKLYQFLINGRTGEVQGQRPYSWIKITLAVLAVLLVVGVIAFFVSKQ